MIVSFATLDPDLLRERMRPGGKKPPLSLRIFSLVLFMHWMVAGLDRGRFHWSDDVPGWLQGVCLFTVAAGYALALWAMRVNRFFSSVIRIQTDRGQHVVTTGPYVADVSTVKLLLQLDPVLRRAGLISLAGSSGHSERAHIYMCHG
jgi:protein-S-isoprenylcysteine O-methyltransferase Ste14